jgi:hypothetical protein
MILAPAAIELDKGTVLVAITVIVLPIAAIAFARSGSAWGDLGKGPFSIGQESPPPPTGSDSAAAVDAVRAAEVRQMIEAKSYLRQRRGGTPIDVEAEVALVLESVSAGGEGIREELWTEVRQMVLARNERRLRRGEAPLDVEAETQRQLADFIGSG